MNVGELRRMIADLPDDIPVRVYLDELSKLSDEDVTAEVVRVYYDRSMDYERPLRSVAPLDDEDQECPRCLLVSA